MDMKDVQHLLQRTIPYPCDNTLSISFILWCFICATRSSVNSKLLPHRSH